MRIYAKLYSKEGSREESLQNRNGAELSFMTAARRRRGRFSLVDLGPGAASVSVSVSVSCVHAFVFVIFFFWSCPFSSFY